MSDVSSTSVVLKHGKFYLNARGDLLGPMVEKEWGIFVDQYERLYHVNGIQWNHGLGSTGNIARETAPVTDTVLADEIIQILKQTLRMRFVFDQDDSDEIVSARITDDSMARAASDILFAIANATLSRAEAVTRKAVEERGDGNG